MRLWLTQGARGPVVTSLQNALNASEGAGLVADGDYGGKTAAAILAVRAKVCTCDPATQPAGVTSGVWSRLFPGQDRPAMFLRCLTLTSRFEGHNYELAAGNWDGAGATWGLIGFTLKSGSLCSVIQAIPRATLDSVFGSAAAGELLGLGALSQTARIAWGAAHSSSDGKKLREPWQTQFATLGRTPEAQKAQHDGAITGYWTPAMVTLGAKLPFLKSERASAMVFDCHVNQGRVYESAITAAKVAIPNGEQAALEAIAKAQAQGTYAANILIRRMTIAKGTGTVHGTSYTLATYGLTLENAA